VPRGCVVILIRPPNAAWDDPSQPAHETKKKLFLPISEILPIPVHERTPNTHPEAQAPMSLATTLAATLSAAILDTILGRLALLFISGAAGDLTAARNAAAQMLAAYHPQTEDELRLAAEIVGFSFHALEALGQAAGPDMPLTRILRLRGSAVSLSRESHKAQRRLDHLQKARRTGSPAATEALQPPQTPPKIDKALDLIQETRKVAAVAKATGQTWTQAYQQRQRAKGIANNLKKNQARHAAQLAATDAIASVIV
jgi:hypothetical protein